LVSLNYIDEIEVLIKLTFFFACYLIYIACFEPGNILKIN